jgi:hypothetical protein
MSEKKYKVIDKFGHVLADNMSLDIALVLVKGYADTYFNEPLGLRIEEQQQQEQQQEESENKPTKTLSHWC